MSILEAARRAAQDLSRASAPSAMVGGLAVSVRADPRNTRDVDFAVSVCDDNHAEEVVRALAANGYGIMTLLEHEVTGRLATVRLRRASNSGVLIDLLFASSGLEAEIVNDAEPIEIAPDTVVPVARSGHLIAMKLLSRDDVRRPQDRVDLAALLATATDDEIERARLACATIEERGYARGRNLEEQLREAVTLFRGAS